MCGLQLLVLCSELGQDIISIAIGAPTPKEVLLRCVLDCMIIVMLLYIYIVCIYVCLRTCARVCVCVCVRVCVYLHAHTCLHTSALSVCLQAFTCVLVHVFLFVVCLYHIAQNFGGAIFWRTRQQPPKVYPPNFLP